MAETTVSSKYQIVIPKEDRERAGIKPGQKLMVIAKHGVIKLIPVPDLREMRGVARGATFEGYREEEDEL